MGVDGALKLAAHFGLGLSAVSTRRRLAARGEVGFETTLHRHEIDIFTFLSGGRRSERCGNRIGPVGPLE